MENGGVTLSVCQSTSVSQTNGILQHECLRISIIHCILVTTMCHQWKSAARLSQNFHYSIILATRMSHQWKSAAQMSQNYIVYLGMENGGVTLSVRWSTSVSQTNGILQHECRRISIIHCILVTTMCHQWKSAARLSQNFHYSIILATRMSHQWKSVAQMLQNYIVYLGMENGGVTLSVRRSTSVSQTNGILRHECHRISIIHCILVTIMCHQWKSAARLSQNFHYSIILATRMCHQWKSVAQMSQNFHHTLYSLLYSLFGDGEGRGYTVCTSVNICQYIVYLGMEKGGFTLSVRRSTSVSQTNGILRHECRRISIIHCILVTTIYSLFGDGEGRGYTVRLSFDVCQSHHQESAARMPQIFDH
jgi:DNA-binding GntR family transcriptional regulator